jgi:hypothetical protein
MVVNENGEGKEKKGRKKEKEKYLPKLYPHEQVLQLVNYFSYHSVNIYMV